ncbi:MAG: hypothetical protein JWM98_2848 [Thermoleophilia bacterium]|nr:hypothetical protein [Thermoleophilia bacterium]
MIAAASFRPNLHQVGFVLANAGRPWATTEGLRVSKAAIAETNELFGATPHVDDAGDAFRHAYAAGTLKLAYMAGHGASAELADRLVTKLGEAHERDGTGGTELSHLMDEHNNVAGLAAVGDARTGSGAWMQPGDVRGSILDALRGGALVKLSGDALAPTGPADVPADRTG